MRTGELIIDYRKIKRSISLTSIIYKNYAGITTNSTKVCSRPSQPGLNSLALTFAKMRIKLNFKLNNMYTRILE